MHSFFLRTAFKIKATTKKTENRLVHKKSWQGVISYVEHPFTAPGGVGTVKAVADYL